MIAHLLGNGPSRKLFKNEPVGDLFGCNLSDFNLPLKATFIMDKVVVDHIHNNHLQMPFPVILPQTLVQLLKYCNPKVELLDKVDRTVRNGESTGHKALEYLLAKGYKEIHMWGFDSMDLDVIDSDTHQKVPEGGFSKNNIPRWRNRWKSLFATHLAMKAKIFIHRPDSSVEQSVGLRS